MLQNVFISYTNVCIMNEQYTAKLVLSCRNINIIFCLKIVKIIILEVIIKIQIIMVILCKLAGSISFEKTKDKNVCCLFMRDSFLANQKKITAKKSVEKSFKNVRYSVVWQDDRTKMLSPNKPTQYLKVLKLLTLTPLKNKI